MGSTFIKLIDAVIQFKDENSLSRIANVVFPKPHTKRMKPLSDLVDEFLKDRDWDKLQLGIQNIRHIYANTKKTPTTTCMDRLYRLLPIPPNPI